MLGYMQPLPGILAYALTVPFLPKYGLLLVAAILEGPIVFFLAGLLIHLGVLDLVPAFISLMIGDLIGDTIYYVIGYRYGHTFIRKFGKYVNVTEENIEKVTTIFKKHDTKILMLSKLTNGFGLSLAVLIAAGMTRLRFTTFIFYNALGEVVWAALLVGAGYFFGEWYTQVNDWVGRAGILFGVVVVVVIFIQWNKYMRSKANTWNA
ncbi:MAG: associated Golgi protein-related protein [Parcubacteria group bacterium]|nr:associated Golgi protein-related protein [Parcubacteria group bacterium]